MLVWVRAVDYQPQRLTIHSTVLILVGMIRGSRDGDDDGDDDAEGLRPAPDFHTWWDSNKGRDLQTPLTPNNTGHPRTPHTPLCPIKDAPICLSVCLSVSLSSEEMCVRSQISDRQSGGRVPDYFKLNTSSGLLVWRFRIRDSYICSSAGWTINQSEINRRY